MRRERYADVQTAHGSASVLWLTVLLLLGLSVPALAASWKTKATLPTPVSGVQVGAINGVLYSLDIRA